MAGYKVNKPFTLRNGDFFWKQAPYGYKNEFDFKPKVVPQNLGLGTFKSYQLFEHN